MVVEVPVVVEEVVEKEIQETVTVVTVVDLKEEVAVVEGMYLTNFFMQLFDLKLLPLPSVTAEVMVAVVMMLVAEVVVEEEEAMVTEMMDLVAMTARK